MAPKYNLRTRIIGFTGRAGSGKDTAANMLAAALESRKKSMRKIACAGPLKEVCLGVFRDAFDVPRSAFYGTQSEKEAPLATVPGWSGRRILQFVGTECFRSIHPDIWSKVMISEALNALEQSYTDFVAVADVRFLSEARAIQEAGGIVVRMLRPEADVVVSNHTSEVELLEIKEDFVIDNQGRELYLLGNLVKDFLCQLNF